MKQEAIGMSRASTMMAIAAMAAYPDVGGSLGSRPIGNKTMNNEKKNKLKQQKAARKKNRRG